MVDIVGLLLLGAALVWILKIAIVGSRGRRSDGRQRKPGARTFRTVRRYRPPLSLEAAATGYAIGSVVALLAGGFWTAVLLAAVLGVPIGLFRSATSAAVGVVALLVQVAWLFSGDQSGGTLRMVLIGAIVVGVLTAWLAGLFLPGAKAMSQLPIAAVLCVDLSVFAMGLVEGGDVSVSLSVFYVLVLVVFPVACALSVAGGPVVPALFALGLLAAEMWVGVTLKVDATVVVVLVVMLTHMAVAGFIDGGQRSTRRVGLVSVTGAAGRVGRW